jgi:hypothetical protein
MSLISGRGLSVCFGLDFQKFPYSLPNCEQLHADLQISWDVVGQTITLEMIGVIGKRKV